MCSSRPVSGLRAAVHARRLGSPARPPGLPRRVAGVRGVDRRPARPPSPATPSGACGSSTTSTTSTSRGPLGLGGVQALPVPGRLELGPEHELELHPGDGHTADGAAYWMPWLYVLVCGDYLSPVEIPMLSRGGSVDSLPGDAGRLRAAGRGGSWVVPGHGAPISSEAGAGDPGRGRRLPGAAGRATRTPPSLRAARTSAPSARSTQHNLIGADVGTAMGSRRSRGQVPVSDLPHFSDHGAN